ncbi:hypothetical protein ALC56_10911 [Trachymyrmex septentrionalis]|uniref:Uncharacterized protein n=1 Tax=Trachymyrmex septentrionalis TaxID=34720 RepID=A0A195F3A3_9HYME|nr:hypothetical protein ALC56_10911 [Trachymyrmex septentrionalis]
MEERQRERERGAYACRVRRRESERERVREREKGREGEWKTARYRPFPGPLSIATPSRLRLRHVICATVGSWNFVSPKITPAHGPSKEGREATRRAAYTRSQYYQIETTTLVAKKRDGCCGRFGVLSRHPSLSGQRARKINNRTVDSYRVSDHRIVSFVADQNRGRRRIGAIMIKCSTCQNLNRLEQEDAKEARAVSGTSRITSRVTYLYCFIR